MPKRFISNLAFLVFLNLLIKPFWILGIDREVQNTVGPEMYGVYFAVFNFSFLFHIILDFGINNYNNRFISQNQEKLGTHFLNIILAKILLAAIYSIIVFSFALGLQFSAFHQKLLCFLVLNQILLSLLLYFRSNIAALQLFKLDALLSVLDRLLMIAICAALLWGNVFSKPFKIEWFVYGQTIGYGAAAIIALILVLNKAGKIEMRWDKKLLTQILKKSYPYALLGLFMTIYTRVDGVMIERILGENGPRQAGIYAAGFRLLDAANMIGFLLATILLPMFSKMLKQNEKVDELVVLSTKLIFTFSILLSVTCFFYRAEIMSLLYSGADSYWFDVFGFLILGLVGISSVYVFGTLLTANGNLKKLNFLAIGGVWLNVILNFILIPKYQAFGAVVATLITQGVVAILHIYLVKKVFNYNVNYPLFAALSIFAISVVGLNIIFQNVSWDWKIEIMLLMSISILVSFILRLFKIKSTLKAFS
jgi:O-antigen/teichoic acid export membrane protein